MNNKTKPAASAPYPFAVKRQHYVPQHGLSRFAGMLANCKTPWLKNALIRYFVNRYPVNMEEALEPNPFAYGSFNEFFTRHLKPDARPMDPDPNSLVSPCDGEISQIGHIDELTLLQAKGKDFSVAALLGCEQLAQKFKNGRFTTIYLAPKDYHRVHMPCDGTLHQTRYLPGKLFSVNPLTTEHVDGLFAKNERLVSVFENTHGSFAIVLVGAMIVGSISSSWGGVITPHQSKKIATVDYTPSASQHIRLDKGEEMGYFSLGSTVILLFTDSLSWGYDLTQQSRIVVGQSIGHFKRGNQ